eukprot:jgi/Psemu1/12044/gm1.12044_g
MSTAAVQFNSILRNEKKRNLKTEKNNAGKFAWFARFTAEVLRLELEVRCRNLPKKDLLSQADGFCVLWKVPTGYKCSRRPDGTPTKDPGRKEEEIGRTEVSRSCRNPTFSQTFRLNFVFHEEQTFVLRVYDEDLRYATELSEHDYLGGIVFTLGQVMGAKGCSLAKRLGSDDDDGNYNSNSNSNSNSNYNSSEGSNNNNNNDDGEAYLVVTGRGVVENRENLDFRFSCQDLVQQHNIIIDKIDRTKIIDKCRPYFRLERLNRDDQSWEVVWKSEVKKQTLNPVWNEARLPLQLLCNNIQTNPLKITICDYEKSSSSHVILGSVETSVAEIIGQAETGKIPVFIVKRDKQKLFRMSKVKHVGLLKVLNASVSTVPSLLQYVSGGMSLDLMVAIDCSVSNGTWGTEDNLHFSGHHWLNDYQAGIKQLGKIAENFSPGGLLVACYPVRERLCTSKDLLQAYNDHIVPENNPSFALGRRRASLNPLLAAATFRTIRLSKKRPCYTVLAVFTAGDFDDLDETVEIICKAAEDAPISIVFIGVGSGSGHNNKSSNNLNNNNNNSSHSHTNNNHNHNHNHNQHNDGNHNHNHNHQHGDNFESIRQLCGEPKLRDSRGIPTAREILTFVSFKQFGGNATAVVAEALRQIPEQFVAYQVINGIKPLPPVPAPDFEKLAAKARAARAAAAATAAAAAAAEKKSSAARKTRRKRGGNSNSNNSNSSSNNNNNNSNNSSSGSSGGGARRYGRSTAAS